MMHVIIEGIEDNPNAAPDPTEAVDNVADPEVPAEAPVQPMSSEGEKYLIDLLVKAFAHTPDDGELKIIDTIAAEYREQNPKQIADSIQKLLAGGPEDMAETLNAI